MIFYLIISKTPRYLSVSIALIGVLFIFIILLLSDNPFLLQLLTYVHANVVLIKLVTIAVSSAITPVFRLLIIDILSCILF